MPRDELLAANKDLIDTMESFIQQISEKYYQKVGEELSEEELQLATVEALQKMLTVHAAKVLEITGHPYERHMRGSAPPISEQNSSFHATIIANLLMATCKLATTLNTPAEKIFEQMHLNGTFEAIRAL